MCATFSPHTLRNASTILQSLGKHEISKLVVNFREMLKLFLEGLFAYAHLHSSGIQLVSLSAAHPPTKIINAFRFA